MKLRSVRIENVRCVLDSEPFTVADVTCLVGKNGSGKTAILAALEKLNLLLPNPGILSNVRLNFLSLSPGRYPMCLGRSLIVMILSIGVGVGGCSRLGKEQAVAACGASLLTGDNQSALRECDRATELDPLNAGLWRNRGIVLAGLQRKEDSLASFDRAVGLAPQDPDAWSGKGSALASLGRYVDAIECHDKALALKPNDELLSANKLATLVELTEKGGKAQIDALLSRSPATSAEWLNRGIVLVALERFPECAQSFAKLLESEPRSAIGWYGKGLCTLHQNKTIAILPFTKEHSDVIHALESAISLAPSKNAPFVKEAKRLLEILKPGESGKEGQARQRP